MSPEENKVDRETENKHIFRLINKNIKDTVI